MQVIGLDAAFDEGRASALPAPSTLSLTPRSSTDWLTMGMPASIDGGAGGAGLVGQFPGMIGVQRNPGRRALDLQRRDHLGADARGLGDRHAGMDPDDPDVIDAGEIRHDLGEPPRRQHQRIAAGQDDFPDFRMRADIVERVVVGGLATARSPCPGRPSRGESRTGNRPRRHAPA